MVTVAQLAFILPSGPEMIVVLVVGIMLFGRRLPQVGQKVARTIVKLRQGFQKLQAEMDLENELRDVKTSFRETRDDLTRVADATRELRDPGQMLQDLTDETLSSAVPDGVLEDVPHSLFDSDGEPETVASKPAGD